jgi:3'(2'), 5'-bisphosphate nucleotidase
MAESFEREIHVAEAAARAAGAAAMRHYGRAIAEMKAGQSPVTAADHASNDIIIAFLQEAFPTDAVLSEESADSGERLKAERVWIIDPLDGTREFLAENGEFAVMIGLAVAGAPVLGVVYRPDGDVLYSAVAGGGAWVERAGVRIPLECADIDRSAVRLVGSRSHPDPLLSRMQEALGITDVLPSGSVGIKCSLIAERHRDLYVHPVPFLKEWDTCAPEVLLKEAGGTVTDCRGMPLRYNKVEPIQPYGIVAAGPCSDTGLVDRISAIYRAETAAS